MKDKITLAKGFIKDENFSLQTFQKIYLREKIIRKKNEILKKNKKIIKPIIKVFLNSKNNPEYGYNFFFSNSYKNIYFKVDENEKKKEVYKKIIDGEEVFFSFKDKFDNSAATQSSELNPKKVSVHYNGFLAPFGEFHNFPDSDDARYIFSPIFPCQFEDSLEKNSLQKMINYLIKFNSIISDFIIEKKIFFIIINAMSMGAIKFVLKGQDLIDKLENINKNRLKEEQTLLDIKIVIIHPAKDINYTGPEFINRKIKSIAKINFKGFAGFVLFKKVQEDKNIIFKKCMNNIVLNYIFNSFKKFAEKKFVYFDYGFDVDLNFLDSELTEVERNQKIEGKRDEFINKCMDIKTLDEIMDFSFDFFSEYSLSEDEIKIIRTEIMQKISQICVYFLNEDDSLGKPDKKNCLYPVKINYHNTDHDVYDINVDYHDYKSLSDKKGHKSRKKSIFLYLTQKIRRIYKKVKGLLS